MRTKFTAILLASFFAVGFAMTDPPSAQAELSVGDEAPEFELMGSDGEIYSSKQFKDEQVVVIAWYPKAFTGG